MASYLEPPNGPRMFYRTGVRKPLGVSPGMHGLPPASVEQPCSTGRRRDGQPRRADALPAPTTHRVRAAPGHLALLVVGRGPRRALRRRWAGGRAACDGPGASAPTGEALIPQAHAPEGERISISRLPAGESQYRPASDPLPTHVRLMPCMSPPSSLALLRVSMLSWQRDPSHPSTHSGKERY